ncbi:MAG TPA: LacI family DNA-binding transcriptional regulator [Verrucomicrobiae bacterium]
MATIHDVARRAGVSTATVSYVINQKRRVSEAVEQRVRAAVAALNYTPSSTARKLKRGRTSVVGFVADNISNRFPARLVHGLATAAAAAGYNILISDLHDNAANEPRALELLVHEEVEGIIYCGFGVAEEQLLQIYRAGTPVIVVDKPPESKALPTVLIDNAGSTDLALEHLFALGHREIRFISGDPNNRNTTLRNEAFRAFMRRHRLPCPDTHILNGAYSLQHGFAAAIRLLDEQAGFTAVFCGDDMIAFGAMAGFKSRGRRIPEDIAVAGFSNDPLAVAMDPGLTTIHYPMVEMGQRAFEVFQRLREKPRRAVPHEWLPTQLIIRRSTDPSLPAFADSELTPTTA